MAELHFDITGDHKNLLRSIEGSKQGIKSLTKEAEKESVNMEDIMRRIGQSAAAIGVGFSATQLIKDVARVRGEFQQLEVALTTMLGSEEKANALFQQLVDTAAKTPFDLQGVAGGAKQLLAYGIAAEEVNDTIIRLGDIAAGLSIPLGDLVYLYGTTMTQGRLFTQDLRQFMGRGIPMADELAKQFGVTKDEVGGLVTAGKVGFAEVEKAIKSMTSEGGKFAGLMENQSKTITGQISNLEDAFDSMLNEIGKSTQGVISSALSTATSLVENYEHVLEVLGQIVVTYGAYKAVMMGTTAFNKAATTLGYSLEIEQLTKLIPLKKESENADIRAAVASGKLSEEMAEKAIAARAEAQALLEELDAKRKLTAHEAAEALTKKRVNEKNIDDIKEEIANLRELGKTKEADAKAMDLQALMNQRQTLAEAAETAQEVANSAATEYNTLQHNLNAVSTQKETLATQILTAAKAKLTAVATKLHAAMLNPYVLAAAAVAALVFVTYKLITAKSAEEKAIDRVNKAREKEQEEIDKRKAKIKELLDTIKDETITETQRMAAYNELKKLMPSLTDQYTLQELKVKDMAETQRELNEEYEKESINKARMEVEKYTKDIERLRKEQTLVNNNPSLFNKYTQDIADAEEQLKRAKAFIKEYEEAQEGMKPIGVRIKEAEDIQKQAEDAYKAAQAALEAENDKLKQQFGDYWESYTFLIPFNIRLGATNAEQAFQDATNRVNELKEQQQKDTTQNAKKQNKKYWEERKKAAEEELEALELSEKGSVKWNQHVAEIREAEKKIAEYDTSGRDAEKRKKQAKKYQELIENQAKETKRATTDMEMDVEQSRIDAMEEGAEKTREQMKLNHKREMEELNREKEDYLKAKVDNARAAFEANPANEGEVFDSSSVSLTEDEVEMFNQKQLNAQKRQRREEVELNKEIVTEMIGEYATYAQARLAKEEEYKKKRKVMEDEIARGNKELSQANLDLLDEERDAALTGIDEQFASKSQVYLGWMESIGEMTIKQLNKSLEEAQAKLNSLEGSEDTTPEDLAMARAQVAKLQERIKQLEGTAEVESSSIQTWKDLGDVLGETAAEFEELGQTISGTTGYIISALGSTFTSTVGLMNNIVKFVDICEKGIKNTSGTAISAIKAVEAASVILAIISAVIQVAQKVASLAKDMHNEPYIKSIEDNKKRIEDLEESYDSLSEKVEEVYGQEKVKSLQEMNDYLERQNRLIREQMADEANVKQKDEEYEEAMKRYNEELKANERQQEENKRAAEEAIFGEDIQSAIESFADAYANALEGNMDMNATAKEQAVRMMKQMVMESIKEYVAGSKKMEQIRAKMDALYADGVFSEADQKLIIAELEQFNKELNDRYGWAEDLFNEKEASSGSSKRGIATASQESVDENNGRLMSIQLSMGEIKEQMIYAVTYLATMTSSVSAGNSILSDIREQSVKANSHLEDIVKYTKPLNERISEVVNAVNRINSK